MSQLPSAAQPERPSHGSGPSSAWTATCVLFGLAAIAITQPVLDILGKHAEFFVAGNYTRSQIIALALVVTWVPGAVAVGLFLIVRVINRRAATGVYTLAVGVFAALFGFVLLRNVGIDGLLVMVPVAAGLAIAVIVAERRVSAVRTFLTYLIAANFVFLGSFLFLSRSSELVVSASGAVSVGQVEMPDLPGPVVVIVLDEFPGTTLLRPDGTINDERFPNFARLADSSTWFRNASSLHTKTHVAVPETLTGRTIEFEELPTYREHPRNLLTLFGGEHPVHRYEIVTDLCPPTMCGRDQQGSLGTAIDDTLTVYGHLTLPGRFRTGLPDITHSWGGFGDDLAGVETTEEFSEDVAYERWRGLGNERSAWGQSQILRERTAAITPDPAVHLIHVALPHFPWTLNQSGLVTMDFPAIQPKNQSQYAEHDQLGYKLHVMQVGATDQAIGDVMDDMQARGVWDDALVAVVSDHGTGLTGPDYGRTVTESNREEALRIPMFIKAPGQTDGETRDDVALTIDLLPSIVDILGVDTNWEFDGHSLFDGSAPEVEPRVSPDVDAAFDVARTHAADESGDDWTGLAGAGEHGDLVGADVSTLREGSPSDLAVSLLRQDALSGLPTPDGKVPYVLAGSVTDDDATSPPPELVVALNGRVAGTITRYRDGDDGWRFDTYLADFFVEGANEIAVFEVEQVEDGPVLHRLSPVT